MLNLALFFIFGSVVGSFLNVCIHRLPRGESVIFPPSHCPHCGKTLAPLDLIPILGFILLKGKCRACKGKISWRYPLVEFLSAVAFPLIWVRVDGAIIPFIFQLIFISVLIVVFFVDLEHRVIPDIAWIVGMVSGLVYNFLLPALLGAAVGFALLYGIGRLGKWWFGKEAVGEGDFYLAAFLGAYLGWQGVLLAIFLAYLLAAAPAMVLIALKKVKMGEYVPFGPALAAGGVIALFFGQQILSWYL